MFRYFFTINIEFLAFIAAAPTLTVGSFVGRVDHFNTTRRTSRLIALLIRRGKTLLMKYSFVNNAEAPRSGNDARSRN